MDSQQAFGANLKRLINESGLSVKGFAKKLGVGPNSPQKWFSGKSYPHRKYHKKIIEILGVSAQQLFTLEGVEAQNQSGKREGEAPTMDLLLLQSILSRMDSLDQRLAAMDLRLASMEKEVQTCCALAGNRPLAQTPRQLA